MKNKEIWLLIDDFDNTMRCIFEQNTSGRTIYARFCPTRSKAKSLRYKTRSPYKYGPPPIKCRIPLTKTAHKYLEKKVG
jgi:hypothetical protein